MTADRFIVESTTRCPQMAASMPVQAESPGHFVGWSLRRNAGVAFTVQAGRLTLNQIGSSDSVVATKVD
jgi:hypothetical protein